MVPLDEPRDIRNGSAPAARNWPARSRRRTCAVTLSIDDEGNGTTGAGRCSEVIPLTEGCEMALREKNEGAPRVTTALLASSQNSAAPHREVRRIF
jgi:hypothetical protein